MKLWWVLKSPWAIKSGKFNSFYSYILSYFSKSFEPAELSICISCAGRMAMLEKVFIPSFRGLNDKHGVTVYLACPENELDEITALCVKHEVQFNIVPCPFKFSRSGYLNEVLKKAKTDFIFISDVDVALPANLYQLYFKHVRTKRAWYPICQMLGEDEKETRSYPEGVGLVGFKQSGNFSLNDEIKTWGNEDWEFLFQLYHAGIYPIRNQNGNFLHYYHPPVDKKNYKKIW
jgi:hypothetical protein